MSVTEAQRHQLYESIKLHLGEPEAETFMNLMPPDWTQFATKADLEVLRIATKADIDALRQSTKADIDALRQSTKADIDALRQSTRADIEAFRLATKADLDGLETRLLRTMGTWLFTSQAVLVGAVGALVAVFG